MDWRDELIESQNKIIAELRAELAQRDKIIAELKERIAELERRLGLNTGITHQSDQSPLKTL